MQYVGRDVRNIEETRSHALRLAARFLGDAHYLTKKLGVIKPGKQIKIRTTPNMPTSESSYGSKLSDTDRSLAQFSEISESNEHDNF
jgi:hypothetical protein